MFAFSSWRSLLVSVVLALATLAQAETAAFDLSGPSLELNVIRGDKKLSLSQVPNLRPQDRLWVHLIVPPGQSVHYLMVIAFLRGSTNPPPENWFFKVETWDKRVRREGITITVPADAQQALLFLAPQTGGDFGTLRAAVRGKPGAFVRASQDLNRASLDRSRLDHYLAAVRRISNDDPKSLHDSSILLARSLNIKLDKQCFDKPTEQQAPCLMQNTDQLVLDDGHSQSMVAALTSGPNSDLIGALSSTKQAGGGAYSPYVGAVMDVARIMGNLHTAQYHYIPALSITNGDKLDLKLNNPPSFRKPQSVMVVGLPAVEAAQFPPLRPVDSKEVLCLQKPALLLPVEGAPLVFSTALAHDFVLQLKGNSGRTVDLPAKADAVRGGMAIETQMLPTAEFGTALLGTVRGKWGFEAFEGPSFRLQSAHAGKWVIPAGDKSALIVGREDVLHLRGDDAACVKEVTVKDQQGKEVKPGWKLAKPDELRS